MWGESKQALEEEVLELKCIQRGIIFLSYLINLHRKNETIAYWLPTAGLLLVLSPPLHWAVSEESNAR